MQKIILIANIGLNNELGNNNDLVFYISSDLKRFKELTTNNIITMGRKTFESFPQKEKGPKPLLNRINIIITNNKNYTIDNDYSAIITNSIGEALEEAKSIKDKDNYIVGGAEIYKQTINIADELKLTIVKSTCEADSIFPEYKETFKLIQKTKWEKDHATGLEYRYETWVKK